MTAGQQQALDATDVAKALALAGELRVVIGTLNRRLREQSQTGDLTSSQKSVLVHLEREGSATVTTLAKALGMRPQSMGATVSTLQAAGHIIGSAHPNDGRQTILSLTVACRRMIRAARSAREDWLFRAIQTTLAPKEQERLLAGVELLKRLVDA